MNKAVQSINFKIDVKNDERYKSVSAAIFELCCRASIKFSIGKKIDLKRDDCEVLVSEKITEHPHLFLLSKDDVEYLDTQNGKIVGVKNKVNIDVISGVISLINFDFEKTLTKDKFSRVSLDDNDIVATPLLENCAEYFLAWLKKTFAVLPTVPMLWKEKTVISLTHDVDGPFLKDLFSLGRSFLYSIKGNKAEREALGIGLLTKIFSRPDPYEMFNEWIEMGELFGQQTFYFFSGDLKKAKRHSNDPHYKFSNKLIDKIETLSNANMEIGLHTGILGHNVYALEEAKQKLEKASRRSVKGVRGHYWTGVWSDPQGYWKKLRDLDFDYDASLNPLNIGFRSGISLPLMPSFWEEGSLANPFVVLPTAFMDAYVCQNYKSDNYNKVISEVSKHGLGVLDWHVRVLSNIGPWKGYIEQLFRLVDALENKKEVVYMSASQTAAAWKSHAEKCYIEG